MICCIWSETKNQQEMLINYLMTHIKSSKIGSGADIQLYVKEMMGR